jgi:hypothetical protein
MPETPDQVIVHHAHGDSRHNVVHRKLKEIRDLPCFFTRRALTIKKGLARRDESILIHEITSLRIIAGSIV